MFQPILFVMIFSCRAAYVYYIILWYDIFIANEIPGNALCTADSGSYSDAEFASSAYRMSLSLSL